MFNNSRKKFLVMIILLAFVFTASACDLLEDEPEIYTLELEIEGQGKILDGAGNILLKSEENEELITYEEDYEEGIIELKADPADDYSFSGWSGDIEEEDETLEEISIMLDEDKTIRARFSEGAFPGGDGSENNPYEILTSSQFGRIKDHDASYFILKSDLDLSVLGEGEEWEPIDRFRGVLDGNGYKISNLIIQDYEEYVNESEIGLFTYMTSDAEIRNLTLAEVDIYLPDTNKVGGIVGLNEGTIRNNSVEGKIAGNNDTGGLAGLNEGLIEESIMEGEVEGNEGVGGLTGRNIDEIKDSEAKITVKGESYVGGLTGKNDGKIIDNVVDVDAVGSEKTGGLAGTNKGEILRSYSLGDVAVEKNTGGGLIGLNQIEGSIEESFSDTFIKGEAGNIGGLVGVNEGNIKNTYSSGRVEAEDDVIFVGGLVGKNGENNDSAEVIDSYSYATISLIEGVMGTSGGLIGLNNQHVAASYYDQERTGQSDTGKGQPRTTAQMKAGTAEPDRVDEDGNIVEAEEDGDLIYEDWDNDIWDFRSVEDYPVLNWQE